MPRGVRLDIPGYFYHCINRTNFKFTMFNELSDYLEFIKIVREALEIAPVKIYAYCLMPNHWHFIISPYEEGGIGRFMHALTNKHTRRYHSKTETIGFGPLYQSRYKSLVIDSDESFLRVFRYVERNAVRAKLVEKPSDWRWGSAWLREYGDEKQKLILTEIPKGFYDDFGDIHDFVNLPDNEEDLKNIRYSIFKGKPFGKEEWVEKMVSSYGLQTTVRNAGRQKKFK